VYQLITTPAPSLEVLTAVEIQAEVFWVMMVCSTAVGYQGFSSMDLWTVVICHNTILCHNPENPNLNYNPYFT
jgi:hypothetical protein